MLGIACDGKPLAAAMLCKCTVIICNILQFLVLFLFGLQISVIRLWVVRYQKVSLKYQNVLLFSLVNIVVQI